MSRANRKGYATVRVNDGKGGVAHVSVNMRGKMAGIARSKNKQIQKIQKQHIREYKAQLREAKKKVPLAERSHIKLEEL